MVLIEKQLCFCGKHSSSHLGFHCQTHALIFQKGQGRNYSKGFKLNVVRHKVQQSFEKHGKVLERLQGSCGKPTKFLST